MRRSFGHIVHWVFIAVITAVSSWVAWSVTTIENSVFYRRRESVAARIDTTITPPVWPNQDPINPTPNPSGIAVPLPKNIKYHVEYNPETGMYDVSQKVGDRIDFRSATQVTREEFMDFQLKDNVTAYWKELVEEDDQAKREFAPVFKIQSEV